MDPLTALSLACNVIALVDASVKAAKSYRELYKYGQARDDTDKSEIVDIIAKMSIPANSTHPDDARMRQIAFRTRETAEELLSLFEHLQAKSGVWYSVVCVAAASLWNRRKIDALSRRLSEYGKALDSLYIARLCRQADKQEFASHGLHITLRNLIRNHGDAFRELNTEFQDLAKEIASIREDFVQQSRLLTKDFSNQQLETSKAVEVDGIKTRTLMSEHTASTGHKQALTELLASLYFHEMHNRQEQIKPAHKETFRWILDRHQSSSQGNADFVGWLEHSNDIFWIEGKPGSGKSTLLNFVHNDPATREYLKAWASPTHISVPAFYFCISGFESQKSITGALKIFAYRIFADAPDACVSFLRDLHETGQSLPAWTQDRLCSVIKNTIESRKGKTSFCFFIDGLDECESGLEDLLEFIHDLKKFDHVKFCVSGRKDNRFTKYLPTKTMLQLHELTKADITSYVQAKIGPGTAGNEPRALKQEDVKILASEIVNKAEGVFLWAYLVVRDVTKGILDCNTVQQLRDRVDSLHSDLELLFCQLIERIDVTYYADTAQSILVLLAAQELPCMLIDFILSTEPKRDLPESDIIEQLYQVYDSRDRGQSIGAWMGEMKAKIHAKCDNFISFSLRNHQTLYGSGMYGPLHLPTYDEDPPTDSFVFNESIDFVHRTVREFFLHSIKGRTFLDQHTIKTFLPEALLMRGSMRRVWIIAATSPSLLHLDKYSISTMFTHAFHLQNSSLAALDEMVPEMERVLQDSTDIITRRQSCCPDHHWSKCIVAPIPCHFYGGERTYIHDANGALTAHGLCKYVHSKLVGPQQPQSSEYLTYLLFATNLHLHKSDPEVPWYKTELTIARACLSFACQLLNLGAKACWPTGSMYDWISPWQAFLLQLSRLKTAYRISSSSGALERFTVVVALTKDIIKAMKVYISHGASLQQAVPHGPDSSSVELAEARYDGSAIISKYLSLVYMFFLQCLSLTNQRFETAPDTYIDFNTLCREYLQLNLESFLRDDLGHHNLLANICAPAKVELVQDEDFLSFVITSVMEPSWPYEPKVETPQRIKQQKLPSYTEAKQLKLPERQEKRQVLNAKQSAALTSAIRINQAVNGRWATIRADKRWADWEVRRICLEVGLDDRFWIRSKLTIASLSDPFPFWQNGDGLPPYSGSFRLIEGRRFGSLENEQRDWSPGLPALNSRDYRMSAILTL